MRHVRVLAHAPVPDAMEVFDKLGDFARYPELVEPVRTVDVETVSPDVVLTTWSVLFRKGLLHWSEKDFYDRPNLRIGFEQEDGDFDTMTGSWTVVPVDGGCDVVFESTFDFGVSSIESIVEPIAARLLKDNVELMLIGLFGDRVTFTPVTAAEEPQQRRYAVLDYSGNAGLVGAPGFNGAAR